MKDNSMNKKVNTNRVAIYMAGVMVLVKLLGFAKQFVLAYFYGSSSISDAFMTASDIPTQVFSFIAQAIATSFIPVYCSIKERDGTIEANRYTSNMVTITGVTCFLICLVMNIFSNEVVRIFANGFSAETNSICAELIRISSIGVLFLVLTRIFSGLLQVHNRFVVTTCLSIPMNIIEIAFIYLSFRYGYKLLGLGMLLGMMSEFAIASLASSKIYRYNPFEKINIENIKRTIIMAVPVIIGVGVNQINKIVDKRLASSIQVGGVSVLGYASIINTSVQDILVTSFITVLFAKVSINVAKGAISDVKDSIEETLMTLSYILIPTTVGVITLSTILVKAVFGYGAFDESAIIATSSSLIFYSIGMLFVSGRDLLIRVFYAFGNTKTPLLTSTVAIAINVALDIILSKNMGLSGLALATSISALTCFILTYFGIVKKVGHIISKKSILELGKMLCSAIVMGVSIKLILSIIKNVNIFVALFICIIIGIIVYFICSLFMKIETFTSFCKIVSCKIKKGRS